MKSKLTFKKLLRPRPATLFYLAALELYRRGYRFKTNKDFKKNWPKVIDLAILLRNKITESSNSEVRKIYQQYKREVGVD